MTIHARTVTRSRQALFAAGVTVRALIDQRSFFTMHVRRLVPLMAPLGVVGAAVIASQTVAMAYPPPAASGKSVSGCATVAQGGSCTYTFQFFDSSGNPIDGLLATLGLDAVPGCSVSPASATTSGGGNVAGTLSCASDSGTGSEIVVATSGNVTVNADVQIV